VEDRGNIRVANACCCPGFAEKTKPRRFITEVSLADVTRDQVNPPLAAGEIVTTGTLTRALPVSVGETWTTELTGVALDGICVRFT
jgi:hypothetical protein